MPPAAWAVILVCVGVTAFLYLLGQHVRFVTTVYLILQLRMERHRRKKERVDQLMAERKRALRERTDDDLDEMPGKGMMADQLKSMIEQK